MAQKIAQSAAEIDIRCWQDVVYRSTELFNLRFPQRAISLKELRKQHEKQLLTIKTTK